MRILPFTASLALALLVATALPAQQPTLASTPPMGWNSWDSYGATINEQQFRDTAAWVGKNLKPFGYDYVTIDAEWFVPAPSAGGNDANARRILDANGRYLPAPVRFPSAANGAGFAPLAAYVHSLGLKFGIHVLQGVPKEAVTAKSPTAGSRFNARDAADISAGCQWNPDNYNLQISPAGQAYYDSITQLYASWDVDLVKIDCISSRPYKGDEIRMFSDALTRASAAHGRPILLSLSPGAAPLDEAANLEHYAQMWRIEDDTWDVWSSPGGQAFPQGIDDHFAVLRQWLPFTGPGHWPDADMLPLGPLSPAPGWGKPRQTALTADEQRTMINLWSITRSPLLYGGDPLTTDPATLALLTNARVIAVDQHSRNTKNPILTETLAIWTADPATGPGHYVAVFNRQPTPQIVTLPWTQIGLAPGTYSVDYLWHEDTMKGTTAQLTITLPAHGSTIIEVRRTTPQK